MSIYFITDIYIYIMHNAQCTMPKKRKKIHKGLSKVSIWISIYKPRTLWV